MPWFKSLCTDLICGGSLGVVKGVFGLSLFTESETEEIISLKKLALSVMEKIPEIATEPVVCEGIRNGQKSTLDALTKGLSPEAVAAGVGTAAQLVCTKSFNERFKGILMGACTNLVGC